jgi:5-methylcytosine-specific restriction endonuclease McrA
MTENFNMSDYQALLLNTTYEPLGFLNKKHVMRLLAKDKVEVVVNWDGVTVTHGSDKINMPAIVRLLRRAPGPKRPPKFQRRTLFERDDWQCQFCGSRLTRKAATIDHLHPRCLGGKTTWKNCVTACLSCNKKKGHKTLPEADMKLKKNPANPTVVHVWRADSRGMWHDEWGVYVSKA